jgi:O-antigen/teichoic acid export membrane protein
VWSTFARYAAARGVPALINFAALALFTRVLDQQQYGYYTLVSAGVALVSALVVQWLGHGVLRLGSANPTSRAVFLSTVIRLFVPLVLAAAAMLAIGIGLAGPRRDPLFVGASVALLVAQGWHDLNLNLASADRSPLQYGRLSAIRAILSLALGSVAAAVGWGGVGTIAGVACGSLITGLWAYRYTWTGVRSVAPDPAIRSELIRYGVPLAGAFLLTYVISLSDRFLLAAFMSPAAAGAYAPGYDLVMQAMGALLLIVNLGGFPLAVAAVERGDERSQDLQFRRHATMLLAVAIPAAAGIAVLAPSVSMILGTRFVPAARALIPLFALAQFLAGFKAFYLDLSFQLRRTTVLQLVTVAVGAVVNIGLNMWLIPAYGLLGAAYATVAAYLVATVLSWSLGRRVLKLPIPYAALARITVATAGMCLGLSIVRGSNSPIALVGQVAAGAALYGLLMVLFVGGQFRRALAP